MTEKEIRALIAQGFSEDDIINVAVEEGGDMKPSAIALLLDDAKKPELSEEAKIDRDKIRGMTNLVAPWGAKPNDDSSVVKTLADVAGRTLKTGGDILSLRPIINPLYGATKRYFTPNKNFGDPTVSNLLNMTPADYSKAEGADPRIADSIQLATDTVAGFGVAPVAKIGAKIFDRVGETVGAAGRKMYGLGGDKFADLVKKKMQGSNKTKRLQEYPDVRDLLYDKNVVNIDKLENVDYSDWLRKPEERIQTTVDAMTGKVNSSRLVEDAVPKQRRILNKKIDRNVYKSYQSTGDDVVGIDGNPQNPPLYSDKLESFDKTAKAADRGILSPKEALDEQRFYAKEAKSAYTKEKVGQGPSGKSEEEIRFMADYSDAIKNDLKSQMTPEELLAFENAKEQEGLILSLKDAQKVASAKAQGVPTNLTDQDLALALSGSKYGLVKNTSKLLNTSRMARKTGLNLKSAGTFLDDTGGAVSKSGKVLNPYELAVLNYLNSEAK